MLKRIKQTMLSTAKAAGVFSLVQDSKWRRGRLLILGYHGIAIDDEYQWNPPLFMHQDQFRERLLLIKKLGYVVLPLSEALDRLYSGDLPPRSLALTFDDGNYDFYKQADPVLKEFGFPATLYLTTFYSYHNLPVFDVMVSYLLWKGQGATLDLKELTGREETVDLRNGAARTRALAELHHSARQNKLSVEEKDDLSARLAKKLHIDYDELLQKRLLQIMTPEEVRQLAVEGLDVQLHTHRHRMPSEHTLFAREIEDNRRCIQSMTNSYPTHFCYPSGVYGDRFFPWLKESGITSAMTSDLDIATRNSEPLLLPRLVDNSSSSLVEFEGWLTGVASVLPQRGRG